MLESADRSLNITETVGGGTMIVTLPGTGFLATSQLTLVKGAKADRSVCSTESRREPRTNAISELLFDKLSKTSGMRFA
jgi:hypothetical protein